MSLKGLFEDISLTKVVPDKTAAEIGDVVESVSYHEADIIDEKRFVPEIDFSKPENFAKYGSAETYYEDSFTYIHSLYPYDGSLAEKLQWRNSGSYIDLYIFDNEYPRTTGYINFSYGGWGTLVGALESGYGTSDDVEYIGIKGGPGLGGGIQDQSANVWDPDNNRESNLEVDLTEGVTVEFWLNKEAFNDTDTEKEVILDVWNNELSSSSEYGRFRLELTGAASGPSWLVTIMSGTTGVQWQTIGSVENATVTDGNWHHYAFSFLSASAGVTTKTYLDGNLQKTETIGTTGINKIQGALEANIGALFTAVSGTTTPSTTAKGDGKLSGSLDEFRYWKAQRSSEKIGRYWFTQVGGGTNTDIANTDLGVYYKFNEGITGVAATDSTVLDYSGRVTNGSWTGYSAGSRNTGSAIVSSSAAASEFRDPIVYSTHPEVVSTLANLKLSGSAYDFENPSQLFSFFPSWMQENDLEQGGELKKLTQIMSSYFDNLYLQLESLSEIQDVTYLSGSSTKENTLANRLLASKGFVAPELFADADILEQLGDRSETLRYRDTLSNIKNKIYQNIYNNLTNIYKTKGTRQSFRNLLRCFGVDEKIYRINAYGNNVQFEVRNNRELNSIKKNYIDFSQTASFGASVFLTSSADSNTVSYLTGSSQLTGGFASTLETYVFFPKKPDSSDKAYTNYRFNSLTSSLFGRHTVDPADPNSLTWATTDNANYQVYAVRDEVMSNDVRFVLTTSAGGTLPTISSSYYQDVYDNTNWIFAVTIKPAEYPLVDYVEGTSTTDYTVEFKGTQVDAGEVLDSFTVTGSYNATNDGYGPITGSTRVYVGAHRTDFEGSVLDHTDVRVGYCRYWLDDVDMPTLQAHGKDVTNYGTDFPSLSPFLFQNNQDFNLNFTKGDTLALNWDFQTVTGSDSSGEFVVADFSSGSSAIQSSRYGFLGNLLGAQHTGQGFGFLTNNTNVIDPDYNIAAELLNFEQLTSEDMIEVLDIQDDIQFTRESRPINFLFAIEKSMYATISEEMIKTFAVISDFNNIVGNPVNKYRSEYKDLRVLRQKFFERVGNTPDLDKYIEYYKWFDAALSKMIEQLIPASAQFSKNVQSVVESHILERSKYQHKFPTLEFKGTDIMGVVESPLPLSPGWRYTHHPVDDLESNNANWWLTRAARNKGKLASGIAAVDGNRQVVFEHTIEDNRTRKRENVYRFKEQRQKIIAAGTNYGDNKIKNYVFHATEPWGPTVPSTNVPQNVMVSFDTDIMSPQVISDDLHPGKKKRIKYAIDPTINKDIESTAKGAYLTPFSLYSASSATDYNSRIETGYRENINLTNLHEDIVGNNDTRPLQGPFTEKFVGGRFYRHTELNDGTDTRESRGEGFRLAIGLESVDDAPPGAVGALGIVPPNYPFIDSPSGSAPHGFLPALKTAHRLRDEGVKRSVNIRNILMSTASADVRLSGTLVHNRIGNYSKNYQIVQTSGRTINDLYFRKQTFDFASYPETLATRGRFPLTLTSTQNVGGALEYELPDRDGVNSNQTVIVNRFSAPGSFAAISRGYLDPAHEEKSVYNVLPYRNLRVLNYGLSGSASVDPTTTGSILVQDQINKPRGLKQLLTLHCGRFGIDAAYGSFPTEGYPTTGSYHKINRNRRRRVFYGDPDTIESVYDNGHLTHPIPRSTQQYQWITASIRDQEIIYGYTELSGGFFVDSLPLISRSVDYADETFLYLTTGIVDPVTASSNTLGYPLDAPTQNIDGVSYSAYANADYWNPPVFDRPPDFFNSLMLMRNGPYQAPSWKQVRISDHPVIRNHVKNSVYSVASLTAYDMSVNSARGSSIKQFTEPVVYSEEMPLRHTLDYSGLNLTLKNTFGNKLIHFATYEIDNIENTRKDYASSDLYFNRINSMIMKGSNKDTTVGGALSNMSVVYSQRVYPAAYNSFLERTRSRQHYSIDNIWDNARAERSDADRENSQGTTIDKLYVAYPSKWSTDAHHVYSSSVSFTYDDGAGELQNSYSRYMVQGRYDPDKNLDVKIIYPAATYNARVPLGTYSSSVATFPVTGARPAYVGDRFNLVMGTFSGSIANAGSGKFPYKTYGEFGKHLRLVGKDYSIVPEFLISKHMEEYLQGEDFTTLDDIDDLFNLTGSGYGNSATTGFFREYSNSDFMKMFDVVNTAYDGAELVDGSKMSQDKIGLKCTAYLQFLPYKGFYPAERTLELATLFSQSYAPYINKSGSSGSATAAVYRALLEPLYSQGVMYNTIKSGIAVSNFVISNTSSAPSSILPSWAPWYPATAGSNISASSVQNINATALPEGNLYFKYMLPPFRTIDGSHSSSYYNENGYFFEKVPFEALYQPRNYLTQDYVSGSGRIYDTGLHSASLKAYSGDVSEENYITWDGDGDSRYELAIDNFLCETVNFFQDGLVSVLSGREEDFGAVTSGSEYSMTLKLYRPTTSSVGYDWADTGSIIPDYDKFDMYRRVSAFGPPLAAKSWSGWPFFAGSASYGASFSHVTPPYLAGSGSCTFTFKATYDGQPTLDEIFSNLTITYDRMEFVELQNSSPSFATDMTDYKVQLKDCFNLTSSVNTVPNNTRSQKKQWLIQSKFETPVINIAGDRRTCLDPGTGVKASGSIFFTRAPSATFMSGTNVNWADGLGNTHTYIFTDAAAVSAAGGKLQVSTYDWEVYVVNGNTEATRNNLYHAITASKWVDSALNVATTSSTDWIYLDQRFTGSIFNQTIANSASPYVNVAGFAGGVNGTADVQYGDVYGNIPEATPTGTVVPTLPHSTNGLEVTPNCQLFTQGLWHDYGTIPSGSDEGVFAIIESPSPKKGKSLAEVVQMPIGQPFRVGSIKERSLLEEAVVAIPFFMGTDDRRKYYKLDEDAQASIDTLSAHLEKYVFPPRFDFVRNPTMAPVAMYVFEFSRAITKQDLADMWQNLPPSIHESFEQKVTVIEHRLLRDQILNTENRKLRQDLRWMVFKVKKRAAMDYTRFIKQGLVDDTGVIPSNINNAAYSYNWPYDYFSLVELVKIDEAIEYNSELPPDSRIEIVGDVNVQAIQALPVRVEE